MKSLVNPLRIYVVFCYLCTVVSLYGNTVTVFLANVFDDQWFTMTDFEQLLTVLDQRMATAMEQATL